MSGGGCSRARRSGEERRSGGSVRLREDVGGNAEVLEGRR